MSLTTLTSEKGIFARSIQSYRRHHAVSIAAREALGRAMDDDSNNWGVFTYDEEEDAARKQARFYYPIRSLFQEIFLKDPSKVALSLLEFLDFAFNSNDPQSGYSVTRTQEGVYIDVPWNFLAHKLGFKIKSKGGLMSESDEIIYDEPLLREAISVVSKESSWRVQTLNAQGGERHRIRFSQGNNGIN